MKKQIKKSLSILMVFCAMMAIFCVPASAASNMHEGTYNGVYFQTRASVSSASGSASLQYGVSAALKIGGTASALNNRNQTVSVTLNAIASTTGVSCKVNPPTGGSFKQISPIFYVKGTKIDSMTLSA